MRVLITGAGSQLTSPLTDALIARGHAELPLTRAELDITDLEACRKAVTGVDAVVNCAAANAVDRCESEPIWAYEGNARGPLTLGRACRNAGMPYVTISTDFVHGGLPEDDAPAYYDEDTPALPINVYGHSKLLGEEAVLALNSRSYVLRTSWVIGERFLDHVRRQIEAGKVGLPAGGHACPAIAQDLCDVIVMLLEGKGTPGRYNVVNPPATERPALLRVIVEALGADPDLVVVGPDTRPAPRPAQSALGVEKLRGIGIEMPDWRDSLRTLLSGGTSPLRAL